MKLKIALVQADIIWEDKLKNLLHFAQLISSIPNNVDLIVLPEMFNTGFTMEPKGLAEGPDGEVLAWIKEMSQSKDACVVGSMPYLLGPGKFANRLIWMFPNGQWEYYDKRHLFSLTNEDKVYEAGNEKLIVGLNGLRICPLICYDLRFPVWSRNKETYDMLIYIASWPKTRIQAWETLLSARAIENQCYCVGLNRIGRDGNGFAYNGHSAIYRFDGGKVALLKNDEQNLITELDFGEQKEYRKRLNFLADQDEFEVKKMIPKNRDHFTRNFLIN